jgi:hypothetical protein
MAAPLRQIYDQMLEPKWVIAMGACASSGGMFNNYDDPAGRRQDRRRRHPRARLPAAARGADGGIIRLHESVMAGVPPALRDARSRQLNYSAVPGLVETREAHGETTLVVDPRAGRGGALPRATSSASTSSPTSPRRLPRLGRQGVSGYIGTPAAATCNRRRRRAPALPRRSRSASR